MMHTFAPDLSRLFDPLPTPFTSTLAIYQPRLCAVGQANMFVSPSSIRTAFQFTLAPHHCTIKEPDLPPAPLQLPLHHTSCQRHASFRPCWLTQASLRPAWMTHPLYGLALPLHSCPTSCCN